MMQEIKCQNEIDNKTGLPAGGNVTGLGIAIEWQNGPLGRDDEKKEPNGAFVEGVIQAARQRIQWYNQQGFKCGENDHAISHLNEAMRVLNARTIRREAAGTEGTHEGN